jgi:hypothetical protein
MSQTPYTAIPPLDVAIASVLNADAGMVALCGSDCVFADDVPAGTARPYVQYAAASEIGESAFMRAGRQSFVELHVWADTRASAMAVWSAMVTALDGVTLTLPGIIAWRGTLTLTSVVHDPTGLAHVIAQYQCDSVEALA